ncbi:hypothetical protein AB1L07_02130 [Niallia alba]|uniref:hypothetical protein n=1 Tax=Niallia alba TaxID=2729105 RepID=UPI0039A0E371
MTVSEYIEYHMNNKGIKKKWLADELGINYKTFVGKLKRDSLTADDLLLISYYLNLELEELRIIKVIEHKKGESANMRKEFFVTCVDNSGYEKDLNKGIEYKLIAEYSDTYILYNNNNDAKEYPQNLFS